MAKYQTHPVIVEAEQFWPDMKPWPDGVVDDADPARYWVVTHFRGGDSACTPIEPGDWVIQRGESSTWGDRHRCVVDDFTRTYERAKE